MNGFKKTLAGLLVGAALTGTAVGILRSPIDRDSFSVGDVTTRVEIHYNNISDLPDIDSAVVYSSGVTEQLDNRSANADLNIYHVVLIKPTGVNAVRHDLEKLTWYDGVPTWLDGIVDWVNGGNFYDVNLDTVNRLASGAFAEQLPDRAKYGFFLSTGLRREGFEPWIVDTFDGASTNIESAPTK
jgi:hypothetical protein